MPAHHNFSRTEGLQPFSDVVVEWEPWLRTVVFRPLEVLWTHPHLRRFLFLLQCLASRDGKWLSDYSF